VGLGKSAEGATVIPRATILQMTVQFALESVSSLPWNHCPVWCGIRVQFGVEYADILWLPISERETYRAICVS
jgi:hypothetical protein